jgi:organic radical activating enzyme
MKNLITEQFFTIQGEGRSVGKPAYFIRFAGCNLWCGWCDSMHSVDPKLYHGKTSEIDYAAVPDQCDLVVITGGEPTLFDLLEVKRNLAREGRRFEVESNATNFPDYVDEFDWNLSPKLKSSAQKNEKLEHSRLSGLSQWAEYARKRSNVTFKFVVTTQADIDEIDELVRSHDIPAQLVYLMAEGQSRESQTLDRVDWIVEACKTRGYTFSPRLHIMLWGDRRGV